MLLLQEHVGGAWRNAFCSIINVATPLQSCLSTRAGNTNSAYEFPISAKEFISRWSKQGPSHHLAIGLGHHASVIEKYAFLLGIEHVGIC